jgi:putative endonuclease
MSAGNGRAASGRGLGTTKPRGGERASGVRTPKQRAGDAAEAAACAAMQAAGCRILARNVRYREGELDIVADDAGTLVFVEVRMRGGAGFGGAAGSVDRFKQRRLLRAARQYLAERFGASLPPCRFDVITADGDGVRDWIRAAFGAD